MVNAELGQESVDRADLHAGAATGIAQRRRVDVIVAVRHEERHCREALLSVPSVIVPLADAPDRNILINHRVANVSAIKIKATSPFTLDPRLFRP